MPETEPAAARRTDLSDVLTGALVGALVIGVALWMRGQPLICTCGYVTFWVGDVFSSGNSQHVADWYTLSHVIHGMLVALIGRVPGLRVGARALLAVAVVTGIAWEVLEHSDWVLDRFRATTLYQGYRGDSVLNAVSDYLWMLGGFAVALQLPAMRTLALIAALEIVAAAMARDSLVLTALMLVHPVQAIEDWQQELNPRGGAGGGAARGGEAGIGVRAG